MAKIKVRVREGCKHRLAAADYDPKKPTGKPGPEAVAGDVIEITEAEQTAFPDKFEVLPAGA